MGSAKRLYLYVVSAVSLLVLAIGTSELLAVAFGEIADRLGSSVIAGGATGREQLSLAIALVVVGGPIFAIHWWLVDRGHRGSGPDAVADRRSSLRALYLGLVSTVAAATALFAAIGLLEAGIRAGLGVPGGDLRSSDDLARLLVAAPLWWIHLRRRNADLRQDRLTDAAAWLSRLVRYGWLFIGVLTLVLGTSQLIDTLASTLIDRPTFGDGEDRWLAPLARALAIMAAGAAIAWLHVADARKAVRDAGEIGEDDRASDLRMTYFGAVLLVALGAAAVTLDDALTELGRQALGVADETGTRAVLETVVGPILVAVPFVLAGWLHWTVLRREANRRGGPARAAAERMGLHLAALIGIAFLGVGAARLGGLLLELSFGSVRVDDFFRSELVWILAKIVVGIGSWLPSWTAIARRRRSIGRWRAPGRPRPDVPPARRGRRPRRRDPEHGHRRVPRHRRAPRREHHGSRIGGGDPDRDRGRGSHHDGLPRTSRRRRSAPRPTGHR